MIDSKNKIIPHIIDQHAEEASFLWLLRSNAVYAPHYSLSDLTDLDERVEAHLDGLMIAEDGGWERCVENLEYKEAGELFVAGVIALRSGNKDWVETVYLAAEKSPELISGLVSAFGWVENIRLRGVVKALLGSTDAFWNALAISVCRVHGADPGKALKEGLEGDVSLQSVAARTVGELGRQDLKLNLLKLLGSASESVAFWSARSMVLLGDRSESIRYLSNLIKTPNTYQYLAMDVLFRVLDAASAHQLLKTLNSNESTIRQCIHGIGVYGDPVYVPWLISQFDKPELSRKAGESLSMITGLDLAYDDLDADQPDGFEAGPSEDPMDSDVDMDEDEDLPWPDASLISQWWQANSSIFEHGQRFFMGQPVNENSLRSVLVSGKQRQRYAAALELSILNPGDSLFNTNANGKQQKTKLG